MGGGEHRGVCIDVLVKYIWYYRTSPFAYTYILALPAFNAASKFRGKGTTASTGNALAQGRVPCQGAGRCTRESRSIQRRRVSVSRRRARIRTPAARCRKTETFCRSVSARHPEPCTYLRFLRHVGGQGNVLHAPWRPPLSSSSSSTFLISRSGCSNHRPHWRCYCTRPYLSLIRLFIWLI